MFLFKSAHNISIGWKSEWWGPVNRNVCPAISESRKISGSILPSRHNFKRCLSVISDTSDSNATPVSFSFFILAGFCVVDSFYLWYKKLSRTIREGKYRPVRSCALHKLKTLNVKILMVVIRIRISELREKYPLGAKRNTCKLSLVFRVRILSFI